MAGKERASDRGRRIGRELYLRAAREQRQARIERGLSLDSVGDAVGLSASEVSRIERGLLPSTSIVRLSELHAVVGLELRLQSLPGGQPIRDASSVDLLARFRGRLHRSWRWAVEVPLPTPGDLRAWDALAWLPDCRYGIEAETAPNDAQALLRRIRLKTRDGGVDGVILLLPETRRVRTFLAAAGPSFSEAFPVPGRRCLELLAAGVDPGGSSIVVLNRPRGDVDSR